MACEAKAISAKSMVYTIAGNAIDHCSQPSLGAAMSLSHSLAIISVKIYSAMALPRHGRAVAWFKAVHG